MKYNDYFFGWTNIKWFITEIGKIYSGQESYFSKKRIESGVAFIIAQWVWFYSLLPIFKPLPWVNSYYGQRLSLRLLSIICE